MAPSPWLKGTVKSVISGDTLLIMGVARGAAPPEKQITLASIKAPRLGRRDGASPDEPFAWKSKEFLRKKAIGQSCVFRTDYTVEAMNDRDFGTVYLGSENLGLTVVENGWAKVNRQGTEKSANFADLERAESIAQTKGLGIWSKDEEEISAAVREMPPEGIAPADVFHQRGKGTVIEGIVDHVLNGSLLRIILLPEFHSITVNVAGVQAPSIKKRGPDGETRPELYALQAKHFTECRLLNRDVKLVLQGLDRYENLFAKVLWEVEGRQCDFGKELLRAAFAKTAEWSLAMMTEGTQEMHAMEREAKEAKKNIWTNYVPQPSNSDKLSEKFKGTVVEVTSGDCITILDGQSNVERRVQFSSVRAPRMGVRSRDPSKGGWEREPDPWATEGKEFLRRLLIGRQVEVQMEYSRKIQSHSNANLVLMFANVETKSARNEDLNVGEVVIENGFASVVKHRTDEERSCIYDRLKEAEARAMAAKINMHSNKEPPVHRLNDVSLPNSSKRAKDLVGSLQRNGKMKGIVEFVMSGHRVKIMIPKVSLQIAFALAGIKAPSRAQPAREGQKPLKGEPFAEEALQFTRRHLLQREVVLQVEACDKGGTFLGTLMATDPSPFDLGLALLEKGLAKLHVTFDESRFGGKALVAAEKQAKEAKIGVWENWTPQVEETEEENGSTSKGRRDSGPIRVAVTHIVDGSHFYIQRVDDPSVKNISDQLASLALSEKTAGTALPKGSWCVAKFSVDNQWYRGYITASKATSCDVYFVDFGNSEPVATTSILPLDSSLASISPQAQACQLSFIKVPGIDQDFGYEAAHLLDSLAGEGRECEATITSRERVQPWGAGGDPRTAHPTLSVILTPVGESKSANASLLEAGLAKLPNLDNIRRPALREGIESLRQHQDVARKQHKGIFVHGDPGDSDEEDLPPITVKK